MFGAPDWVARRVVILLAIDFLPALVVSWVFELTPDSLKRDSEVIASKSIAHALSTETALPLAVVRCSQGIHLAHFGALLSGMKRIKNPEFNFSQVKYSGVPALTPNSHSQLRIRRCKSLAYALYSLFANSEYKP